LGLSSELGGDARRFDGGFLGVLGGIERRVLNATDSICSKDLFARAKDGILLFPSSDGTFASLEVTSTELSTFPSVGSKAFLTVFGAESFGEVQSGSLSGTNGAGGGPLALTVTADGSDFAVLVLFGVTTVSTYRNSCGVSGENWSVG